jgi:hypothetical protein
VRLALTVTALFQGDSRMSDFGAALSGVGVEISGPLPSDRQASRQTGPYRLARGPSLEAGLQASLGIGIAALA